MYTDIIKITEGNSDEVIAKASEILKSGGLVVFQTQRIFIAKGRPSDNPLIIHVCDLQQLTQLTDHVSPVAQKLINKFWPGPLTIIFPKKPEISEIVSGGLDTIAVRMPKFTIAQQLIEKAGVPIAAPSANISGRPSSTSGVTAYEDLIGKVDMILDAGESPIGVESTVVKISDDNVSILRPGAVTLEMLEEAVSPLPVILAVDKKD
jgi:L-threonylcarbamoyladenylate synthase